MKLAGNLLTMALALSLAAGCGTSDSDRDLPASGGAPTLEQLRNASYDGLEDVGPVTLVEGRWEDEPNRLAVSFPRDFHVIGDLDGSAPDEAVVLLAVSTGGSGTFTYLAVVGERNGQAVNIATAPLGDRVAVRDLRIEDRTIVVDVLQAGADDAMCCPGELATRRWRLEGHTLTETPPSGETTSRLSLETLGAGTWVLSSWSFDESAPSSPEVTLQLSEGRLVGSSGCNTYTTSATPGDMPGDVTIGPVAGTRMMCPDAEMDVEGRFLTQLAGVTKYGFMLGQLALTYRTDDSVDVMLFERR